MTTTGTSSRATGDVPADLIIDARALRCPLPVLKLEAALRAMVPGGRLRLLSDDPIAAVDVPYFCEQAGHDVVRLPDEAGACVFQVTRAPNP